MDLDPASTASAPARWEARALRIGTALKQRRIALGLTQADLAMRSGLTRAEYELAEKGEWPGGAEADSRRIMAAVERALERELDRQALAARSSAQRLNASSAPSTVLWSSVGVAPARPSSRIETVDATRRLTMASAPAGAGPGNAAST